MKLLMGSLLAGAALLPLCAQAAGSWDVTGGDIRLSLGDQYSPIVFTDINGIYGQTGRRLKVVDTKVALKSSDAGQFTVTLNDETPDDDFDRYDWNLILFTQLSYSLVDASTGQSVAAETHDLTLGSSGFQYTGPGYGDEIGGAFTAYAFGGNASGIFSDFSTYKYQPYIRASDDFPGDSTLTLDQSVAHFYAELKPEFGGRQYVSWYSGNVQITPVPEPETYALLAAGLMSLGLARRKNLRRA